MLLLNVQLLLFYLYGSAFARSAHQSDCIGATDTEIVNGTDDCPEKDFHEDQNPDLFQGDIVGVKTEEIGDDRNALRALSDLWPKIGAEAKVPYVFDSIFGSHGRSAVQQAINDFNQYTCVRFVPRGNEQDYIKFTSGVGCSSNLGKTGGQQFLSLGGGCQKKGIAIHEMIHAIGFLHEQARPDRDQFVTIQWNNIQPGREPQFTKGGTNQFTTQGIQYDFSSVMHYSENAFSRNGRPTIVAKTPGIRLGQRRGFSRLDIEKVNKLYNCNNGGVATPAPTNLPIRTNPPSSTCKDLSGTSECLKALQRRPSLCSSNSANLCERTCRLC